MRLEYGFDLTTIKVPRFSVEADESIGKLFTLATLMLNVMENRPHVELVFHGLNSQDPERKIESFKEILEMSGEGQKLTYTLGNGGQVTGSSVYFRWLTAKLNDA
jgi:hypothetical protein